MGIVLTNNAYYAEIAAAIRKVNGSTDLYLPSQMAAAILALGGGLPAGYTKLAYIQSTGTQYINTLFKPNQDTRIVVDAQIADEQSGEGHLFSARDNATNGPFWIMLWQSDAYKTRYATQGLKTFDGVESRSRHVFDFNKNVSSIDGVSLTFTAATFQLNTYLPLFCRFTGTTVDCITKMKLYSCQIYENSILVRDFVPCINPDGEYGLYDKVNKTFYGNAGTGSFTGA